MINPDNDEYTGKPTKARRNVFLLVLFLLTSFFIGVSYMYYKAFTNYEAGNEITVDSYSFALYTLGGKWLNIGIYLLIAGYFGFHAIKIFSSQDKLQYKIYK